ncbi:MurT ligase domain-containing protein [Dictyobacter halimunensis]|uniref:MurT ligase domain-containing protein n=1 Tax=Dictyobacter halimunensis TaxID=3026934 RepID=UPI0030C6EED6
MRKEQPSQPVSSESDQQPRESLMETASLPPLEKKESTRKPRGTRRQHAVRAGVAVMAGRTAGAISRRLHLGGGTSIVGVVAQRVYPDIVEHLATELEHGSVMITGTNGKTTTSSFIAAILRDDGLRVWRNREGSNLVGGVASSLVIRAQPNGHLRRAGQAISILEVDEAALPQLVGSIPPRVLVFTNLFRDQLDRYGEVDSVISKWKQAIALLPATTTLVLNADDPTIAQLGDGFPGRCLYYGIETTLETGEGEDEADRHQVMDARVCSRCGHEYEYDLHFYSHMGHYHCPQCGKQRPRPDVRVTHVQVDTFDRIRLQIEAGDQKREIIVPLPGFYNIYNALAASTASLALGTPWEPIISGIEQSKPVFGRGERIQADGKTMRLLLAKNPTGFNEVLRTLFNDGTARHLLFILNDNIADGQDISWIWDVDFERAVGQTRTLVISGTRALDLALRLKYAGINENAMTIVSTTRLKAQKNTQTTRSRRLKKNQGINEGQQQSEVIDERLYGIKNALDSALQQTPAGETLFVVPTYTGLLEVHHELEQRGFTPHYWEGRDA